MLNEFVQALFEYAVSAFNRKEQPKMSRKSKSLKLNITFINPNSNKEFEELLRIVILDKIKNSQINQLNIQ